MKTIIDVNKWERAEHFSFFRTFLDPMIGLTTNIACERFKWIWEDGDNKIVIRIFK